ncbi:hypothetical protein H6F61_26570 [Cyanobacteria bacterium FACHB-472]|nr:hypothetical protein [Cyanobacteria bacterium FACHB-472]
MSSRFYSSGYSSSYDMGTIIGNVLAFVICVALWCWGVWHLTTKMGIKGRNRWVILGLMCIPYLNGLVFLATLFWPWPIWDELRNLRLKVKDFAGQSEALQSELEASQKQVERNVDYIRKANLEIQRLQGQLISK